MTFDLNWGGYFCILIVIIVFNWFLLRRMSLFWADPQWVVILQVSFTLTTVLYSALYWESISSDKIILIVTMQGCFLLGVLSLQHFGPDEPRQGMKVNYRLLSSTRFLIIFLKLSVLILLMVLILRLKSGLFIFSPDPELARTLAKQGGEGYLYRITLALSTTIPSTLVAIHFSKIRINKFWSISGWSLPLFLTVTTGYKADLVFMYSSAFFCIFFLSPDSAKKRFKARYVFAAVAIIIGISFFAIARRFDTINSATDANRSDFTYNALIGRFILNGSGLNYYLSSSTQAFNDLGPTDFFMNNIVVAFLGPLGLVPYPLPLGNRLNLLMTGSDVFGPNPTMFMEGFVYWGKVGSNLYCFTIGLIYSFSRKIYPAFKNKKIDPAITLIVGCYLSSISLSLTVDIALWVAGIISFIFIVAPIIVVSKYLTTL